MTHAPAIAVRRLRVQRGGRRILSIENLTIDAGEVVAILGPNGAGKSTLLKCLLGFVRPTAGEIAVLDERVFPGFRLSRCRLRRRIGYVPQVLAARTETPLTAREVAAIGRTGIAGLFRRLRKSDWAVVDFWLAALGLADRADAAYASLSSGEQRKILIAKAMIQQPDILVLDEPTANLDLYWREQIVGILQKLHADFRLTILLVCHELEVLPTCSGRLLVLRDGAIAADGTPRNVLNQKLVEDLYGAGLRLTAADGRFAVVPGGGNLEGGPPR